MSSSSLSSADLEDDELDEDEEFDGDEDELDEDDDMDMASDEELDSGSASLPEDGFSSALAWTLHKKENKKTMKRIQKENDTVTMPANTKPKRETQTTHLGLLGILQASGAPERTGFLPVLDGQLHIVVVRVEVPEVVAASHVVELVGTLLVVLDGKVPVLLFAVEVPEVEAAAGVVELVGTLRVVLDGLVEILLFAVVVEVPEVEAAFGVVELVDTLLVILAGQLHLPFFPVAVPEADAL
jgi:hypothetical protein